MSDEGVLGLQEAVDSCSGLRVMADDNFASDEVVGEIVGRKKGGDWGECVVPNDGFNRPTSEIYAGRGEGYKLPEMEWGERGGRN